MKTANTCHYTELYSECALHIFNVFIYVYNNIDKYVYCVYEQGNQQITHTHTHTHICNLNINIRINLTMVWYGINGVVESVM